jgi:hypothetical protein
MDLPPVMIKFDSTAMISMAAKTDPCEKAMTPSDGPKARSKRHHPLSRLNKYYVQNAGRRTARTIEIGVAVLRSVCFLKTSWMTRADG